MEGLFVGLGDGLILEEGDWDGDLLGLADGDSEADGD